MLLFFDLLFLPQSQIMENSHYAKKLITYAGERFNEYSKMESSIYLNKKEREKNLWTAVSFFKK